VVNFIIGQEPQTLPIRYIGKDPPPDTLLDGATAYATGTLGRDGVFLADTILTLSAAKGEHASITPVPESSIAERRN
jgi:cytochrome c-type biogenesis protein CcmE